MGKHEKAEFRLRWAESKWAEAQTTKEEDEMKEESLNSTKTWKTMSQLRKVYGTKKAARRHAARCHSMGEQWAKWSSFAGVWLFKHIEVEEKASSKKKWKLRKRFLEDRHCPASRHV